jgi:hypothetical protein
VSSRLPGGAGLDLMEENYDLKGFQIKAKSCDWGPMAGFICQLPFLNKEGYDKIAYNAGYIMDYMIRLDEYNSSELGKLIRATQVASDEVRGNLENTEKKRIKDLLQSGNILTSKEQLKADLLKILVEMLQSNGVENIHMKSGAISIAESAKINNLYQEVQISAVFEEEQAVNKAVEGARGLTNGVEPPTEGILK